MTINESPSERYHIRAVERALVLLKVFLTSDTELGLRELSGRTQLDVSTTFRMLATLESQGFVKQGPGTSKYRLGTACLELGSQFLRTSDLRTPALPVMERLRNQFGETVHLGVLDRDEIVYIEKIAGLHPIGLMSSRVGSRAPAHSTAIGKVLLAYLPAQELERQMPHRKLIRQTDSTITNWQMLEAELERIRVKQYAVDNQEHEVGVKCVAIPIFGHKGIAAALSISGPVDRMDEHIKKHGMIETLQQAMREISTAIGWGRGVDQIGRADRGIDGVAAPHNLVGHPGR